MTPAMFQVARGEKTGSSTPSVLDLTALTFSEKKRLNSSTLMHELARGRPRLSSWLTEIGLLMSMSVDRSNTSVYTGYLDAEHTEHKPNIQH